MKSPDINDIRVGELDGYVDLLPFASDPGRDTEVPPEQGPDMRIEILGIDVVAAESLSVDLKDILEGIPPEPGIPAVDGANFLDPRISLQGLLEIGGDLPQLFEVVAEELDP